MPRGIALPGDEGKEKTPGDVAEAKTSGGSPMPRPLPLPRPHQELIVRQGANLPHWRMEGATYAVTFRLADSLPRELLVQWKAERDEIVQRAERMGRPLTAHELRRLDELHGERVEKWLDKGHGSCALREERMARLVRDAMIHFDGQRYELAAWCVMPNHVHAVLHPFPGRELSMILLSWKGFTGKKAREMQGRVGAGEFWQRESYDYIVRDEADYWRQIRYVAGNPAAAGLVDWPWVGGIALPGDRHGEDSGRYGGEKTSGGSPMPRGIALPGDGRGGDIGRCGEREDIGRKPDATGHRPSGR